MSEILEQNCLVNFIMGDTKIDESGAHAKGYIYCDLVKCMRSAQTITGDVKSGAVTDSITVAEAKVLRRARAQIIYECAVWKADPANVGQDIPNEKLPQILQRPQS